MIGPDDELYDVLRRPALPQYRDIRPLAIARCASIEDVVEALAYARSNGLPVAPRGGGHCFAGRSSTTGLLLELSGLNAISVQDGLATIGAGARLAEVYRGLHEYALTIPAGCGPTVGIAGLTLGGGLGLLGRRYGLTCDRLVAATVVLADGTVVTCDEDRESDLFWALRGSGGGQFGVVTSLVFAAVPSPAATLFSLTWPRTRAAEVIAAWQTWAPDAPDELTASLTVTLDEVRVFGATLAPFDPGPLRGDVHLRDDLSWPDLKRSLSEGPPDDRTIFSKSEFFRSPLPADVITDLLDSGCELNFTPMGGAYNRVPVDATAFPHRTERFLLEHASPDQAAVRRSWSTAHPHASGRVYPNFPDPDLTDWQTPYHGPNYPRLVSIKDKYDPDGVFHFPQGIGADR
ncbi:FAD-binding oxidoreductase [Kribbella kalugense]|uniref:FAD/FMN-containing dehydrogenase n=1 Tax=Kribbella kalugense TaxID=2512221 RepID=A0A4R8A0W1_9ACTN|nr:FAD-binding oxidoreductase [Kribbella kalugense]TDW21710.1 FAD/FMN-containing dehydrogenase [Kribbella kalugense]